MIELMLLVFCIFLHSRVVKAERRLDELEAWTRGRLDRTRES